MCRHMTLDRRHWPSLRLRHRREIKKVQTFVCEDKSNKILSGALMMQQAEHQAHDLASARGEQPDLAPETHHRRAPLAADIGEDSGESSGRVRASSGSSCLAGVKAELLDLHAESVEGKQTIQQGMQELFKDTAKKTACCSIAANGWQRCQIRTPADA